MRQLWIIPLIVLFYSACAQQPNANGLAGQQTNFDPNSLANSETTSGFTGTTTGGIPGYSTGTSGYTGYTTSGYTGSTTGYTTSGYTGTTVGTTTGYTGTSTSGSIFSNYTYGQNTYGSPFINSSQYSTVYVSPLYNFYKSPSSMAVSLNQTINWAMQMGFQWQDTEGCVFDSNFNMTSENIGTAPLGLFYNPSTGKYATLAANQSIYSAMAAGYQYTGQLQGYVLVTQVASSVPLIGMYNPQTGDVRTVADGASLAQANGYTQFSIEGFVLPHTTCSRF